MTTYFKEFSKQDYQTYSGVYPLPTGEAPNLTCVKGIDIILSGDGEGNTIISMIYEDKNYMKILPGFDKSHKAIVKAIADDCSSFVSCDLAISNLASEYGFVSVF